jgi:hypothetical protein
VRIVVRSDNGLASPGLYDYCEDQGLLYACGFASNAVLQRATATALADLELYHHFYQHREPHVQAFTEIRAYQAGSWRQPRRLAVKLEVTAQGSQRRFVVHNLPGTPEEVYRGFYVQRGKVPEQPLDELKNGLRADRLSACGFCANAFRLLVHVLAYAIAVLFREASAAVPEVAQATVSTLRQHLWKVAAVVVTSPRRIWLRVSETWPGVAVWRRVQQAVTEFVERTVGPAGAGPQADGGLAG